METPERIRDQRVVGGNLALDLLNTQNGSAGEAPEDDLLRDYGDLVAWAHHVGLLNETEADHLLRRSRRHPDEAREALERTRKTRSYLYSIFDAVARGSLPPHRAIDRLQRDEAEGLGHAKLVRVNGSFHWSWANDDELTRPLWPIVHAALTLVTDGPLDRVKGCAACRFHFLDESKNRSRRWCSMEDCGTADKMRKYVARRASARSASRTERVG
jgi:predicted RNA-binding Zn ribbon-like protein